MNNLGNKVAAYGSVYSRIVTDKFNALKERENGDVVQTVIITAVFIIAAVAVGNWINSVVQEQMAKANASLGR